jgi:hypothetical protein
LDPWRLPCSTFERAPKSRGPGPIGNEETDVLKKTSAATGLVIVTAAGALLASSPAYALDALVRGSHVRVHHRSHHRNRNWNGNRHHARIFIRIYIYNKNNNHAVALARPERRRRELVRDAVPTDGVLGAARGLDTGALGTRRAPVRTARQEAAPVSAPEAATNQSPANTTPATGSAAPMGAPALDEGATGNVSP